MASISPPPFLLLLLLLLTIIFHPSTATAASRNHTGFTLKLIHRDTLESGNLTSVDLRRRRLHRRRARSLWRQAAIQATHTYKTLNTKPYLPAVNDEWEFAVEVSIGTPAIPLYLLLDTGSGLTWTQNRPCNPCFPQDPPHYSRDESSSYADLPCSDVRCPQNHVDCDDEEHSCTYKGRYGDGTMVAGVYATETFTFQSMAGEAVVEEGFVFGCTMVTTRQVFGSSKIAGILGMNRDWRSFMSQTQPNLNGGRFSYCMAPPDPEPRGHLSFGDDIPPLPENAQTTPLGPVEGTPMYYVDMVGISFNGRDIGVPPDVFGIKADGTGGTMIDTGVEYTDLISPAYVRLMRIMDNYFINLEYSISEGEQYGLIYERCYDEPVDNDDPWADLPTVTFRFRGGAELVVEPDNLFAFPETVPGTFCVALTEFGDSTLVGALQMANIRFVFDLGSNLLSFASEECGEEEGLRF